MREKRSAFTSRDRSEIRVGDDEEPSQGTVELGLGLDLCRGAALEVPAAAVEFAERFGYLSVRTAEAFGCVLGLVA